MKSVSLNGTWQLTYGPQERETDLAPEDLAKRNWPTIEAIVPGNVELDLVLAGVLPANLEQGDRIYELRPYETYEWWYARTFETPSLRPEQRVELVFEGLDCVGTIWLNGHEVGRTDNMLIAHRFDVTDLLRRGADNQLVVRIASAVLEGRRRGPEAYEFAFEPNWESLGLRKAPHMYGWDIMPRVVSAGLWRDVCLRTLEPTRWRTVYWATLRVDPQQRTAAVLVDWDFVTDRHAIDGWQVRVRLERNGQVAHESRHTVMTTHGRTVLNLKEVDLWWPRGAGEPALYEATLDLLNAEGDVLDRRTCRVGVRTVELQYTEVTTESEPGEFLFLVNGRKTFIKGTNWVPLDALHSRDREHLAGVFEMLVDLNCNMVRCWGGNVYEDHAFFDLCDAHGVMVWQDFAMACAIYPQTDEFAARIRAEAEHVVAKLRNHPSLVLWSGNNEVDMFYAVSPLHQDPNVMDRLSRQVLPDVVRRLDPTRPYLPSSPYRGPQAVAMGGDAFEHLPENHLWGPRNDFKGSYYLGSLAHFVSEIGYHGCPDRASLERMMDPGHLWPWRDNEQWLTHAVRPLPAFERYNYRIELMARQIAYLFGQVPDNLNDFILASQISQAEALKFFIEWFRAGKWRRTGMLWWNLRDGWPILSDAVVDYYNCRKLAYDYIKRVQVEVCAIVTEPDQGRHAVVVVNDLPADVRGRVHVRDADAGTALLESDFVVQANEKTIVGAILQASRPAMWLVNWTLNDGTTGRNHYLAGPRPFDLAQYRQWLIALGLPARADPTSDGCSLPSKVV